MMIRIDARYFPYSAIQLIKRNLISRNRMKKLRELAGLGPKSEAMLESIGIHDVDAFMGADPFEIYAQLKQQNIAVSRNMIYALIGAQEGIHWQQVAKHRKTEILFRLDDMGLA